MRCTVPEPQTTFVQYHTAVENVLKGASISEVLNSAGFQLENGEHAHDQFWRMLVNRSYALKRDAAEDAIKTLIEYLPAYSTVGDWDRALRKTSIYSLARLLDRAGWGRTEDKRLANSPENIIEIAWRIFGENEYKNKGILDQLVGGDRGVLGWNDLMLFRLTCSADRGGQLHNLHSALIVHQDVKAATTGLVEELTKAGMQKLSQKVFELFESAFINKGLNFYSAVDDVPAVSLLAKTNKDFSTGDGSLDRDLSSTRTVIKSFVIYQLSNSKSPTGSGVGCGFYHTGKKENEGRNISDLMNDYVFGLCFNPQVSQDNIYHFLDHCLSHLTRSLFADNDESAFTASEAGITAGFSPEAISHYWAGHRELIMDKVKQVEDRVVHTPNYTASYKEDLDYVFKVLDALAIKHPGL